MGKCMECGKETSDYLFSDEIYRKKYGYDFLCRECKEKKMAFYDWENEQFEMEEIVCPWCGYEFSDSYEFDFGSSGYKEIECEDCEKTFEVELNIKYLYTSRKRRCDFPGVGDNNAN